MKSSELKKMLKEAVREAMREELQDILVEAINSAQSTSPVTENTTQRPSLAQDFSDEQQTAFRQQLRSQMMGGDMTFNSGHAQPMGFNPPPMNTAGEGSALPSGEVSMDQIMGLMR